MHSDDSFNDSDEIFNLYSSKKVTETFNSNLRKLVSKRVYSGDEERSEGVLKKINCNEEPNSSIKAIEDLLPKSNKKGKNAEVSAPAVPRNKEPSSEDSIDIIEIIEENLSTRATRKSPRLRRKRVEAISDSDDSITISPEPAPRNRKKTSNLGRKSKNKKKNVEIEEIVLDDSLEQLEKLDEDELNPEVSVKVIWKSVGIKKFQIRKFQKMSKIYEQLSKEENIPEDKIVLTFNNVKVNRNDSPDSLNLQVYHFIDGGVLSELTNRCEPSNTCTLVNDNKSVTLKFQGVANKVVKVVLNKDDKMKIGMIKYAEQLETPLEKIKFFFDGESLDPSETPTSLGLEGDEIIDVKILS